MKTRIQIGIIEDDRELAHFLKMIINSNPLFRCDSIFYTVEEAINKVYGMRN